MDRAFLAYYEDELAHLRGLAAEFAELHPAVARNLSLDNVPCPDPYVERLLEGVAFLAARTRQKLDGEAARYARSVLDALYPDLVAPTPATGIVALLPGRQVQTMLSGHVIRRGTRLVSGLRPGLSTRCTYVTAQDVTLWPIELRGLAYIQDRSALSAAGIGAVGDVRPGAALRLTLGRTGQGALAELDLDRLDLHFRERSRAPVLFDTLFAACPLVTARPEGSDTVLTPLAPPGMVGIADDEAMLPCTRPGFEGYRLLREYFVMPERFHFARVEGLRPVVRRAGSALEVVFLLARPAPELADVAPSDLQLFATPIANLFERDCNMVDLDARRVAQPIYADRTRPRDFEIYRVVRVEDAEADGPDAVVPPVDSLGRSNSPAAFSVERRPRRPGEDERRQGQMRTSYAGDDVFLALAATGAPGSAPKRLDIRALCTNRDLALLDDTPALTLETGDPVETVRLLGGVQPPRPSLTPSEGGGDALAWRLVAQLSLNFLSLAEEGTPAPLHALLELYVERGNPALSRHVRSIARISSRPVTERLAIDGPICFGRGTEITLDIDQSLLAGHSVLLLSALLSRLFARHVAINAFVRTQTRVVQRQEEVAWPMTPGNRCLI